MNRAAPVEGVEQITDTIQQRRLNPELGELRQTMNGSFGYFDAARVTAVVRSWQGLSVDASYWFSKAIDLGTNYTNTAAGQDAYLYRSPSQYNIQDEMKSLSNFDQPHAVLVRGNYELPWMSGSPAWLRKMFSGWNVGAVALAKSGTPFSVRVWLR